MSFIPKITVTVGGYKFRFALPTADQRAEMVASWERYRQAETAEEMDKIQKEEHVPQVLNLCLECLSPDAGDNWKEDAQRNLFSGPTATKLLMDLFRSPAPIVVSSEE